MSKSELRKYLASLGEDDLRKEVISLHSKVPEVKAYYAMELGKDEDRKKIYDKAKKDIWNLFYVRKLPRKRPRIQKIKALLKEREKLAIFTHETIDLYLYATETAIEYLLRRPRTTKATYNSCIENYSKACKLIQVSSLQSEFKERCQGVVRDADLIFMLEQSIAEIYNDFIRL